MTVSPLETRVAKDRSGQKIVGVIMLAAALPAAVWLGGGLLRPEFVLSGLVVGFIVGLTGVGGGSLMTPLLILLFGLHPASAIGTDLIYASATKAVGTTVHAAHRSIDWGIVGRLSAGSLPATALTLIVLRGLRLEGDTARLLTVGLGGVLLLTAASLVLRDRLAGVARRLSPGLSVGLTGPLTVGLGALLGVLITLTSIGAGALGLTVLVFLYPRMPLARIVGADIVHAVPLTLLAGLGHLLEGSVDLGLLISLLCGSIPGVVAGSLLSPKLPERALRIVLAGVLTLVAVRLLV